MDNFPEDQCYCKRCSRWWGWHARDWMSRRNVHYVDLFTSLGETTACGRELNWVPGCTTTHWQLVTCRACRAVQAEVERFKTYPLPK